MIGITLGCPKKVTTRNWRAIMRKTDFWVQTCLKWPKLSQFQRVHVVQNYVLPTLPSIFVCSFFRTPSIFQRTPQRKQNKKYTYDEWKTNNEIRNDGTHQLKGVSTVIKSKCWKISDVYLKIQAY